jgi:putative endonuclease
MGTRRATYTRDSLHLPEVAGEEVAYVYLLHCGDGTLYCGWTVDLERRLAAHRSGRGAKYTRTRLPVALAAAWRTPDHSTARRLEVQIKQLRRAGKQRLVAGEPLAEAAVRLA